MRKSIVLALCLLAAPALAGVPAPVPSIRTLTELPVVTMKPYDEKADAKAQVAAAFARANHTHKRVLIDLGGNWCPDCIILANFLKLPEMRRFMAAHYELVAVDLGRFDRNRDIPARFGLTKRLTGVPTVLIADPDGRLVNRGHVFAFTDARHMTPEGLADYLANWAR
jgi:thiol-disulfide isomerase/thioredoxin